MNYIIADIHNDNRRLQQLLQKIHFGREDHLFLLGDLFDRCSYDPDPVGVYFSILEIEEQCTIVSGNHDRWLAEYIREYFATKEKKRYKLPPYPYNSFNILSERLVQGDILQLAEWIIDLPLQVHECINGKEVLLAHAMTSDPRNVREDPYYLLGEDSDCFYTNGIEGYISFCGHSSSSFYARYGGTFLGDTKDSIWKNDRENVYMMDCGCGYSDGKLACLCLDDMRSIYV